MISLVKYNSISLNRIHFIFVEDRCLTKWERKTDRYLLILIWILFVLAVALFLFPADFFRGMHKVENHSQYKIQEVTLTLNWLPGTLMSIKIDIYIDEINS